MQADGPRHRRRSRWRMRRWRSVWPMRGSIPRSKRPSLRSRMASSSPSSARPAAENRRCSTSPPGLLQAGRRHVRIFGQPLTGLNRRRRLSVSGRCAVSLEDRDRQCRDRARDHGRAARRGAEARAGLADLGRSRRLRQPLSAHAVGRPAQARRPGAGPDPRSQDPADGRAVRAARCADPADHGQSAARALERRPQGGAVRHPRSRRGDRAGRPRRHHVGGARRAHHRRLAGAAGAAARHLRRSAWRRNSTHCIARSGAC